MDGAALCVALFQAYQFTASVSTLSRPFLQIRKLRLREAEERQDWPGQALCCVVTAQVATCRPCVESFG